MSAHQTCVIVGRGRAGHSFQIALARVGWSTTMVSGHMVASHDGPTFRLPEETTLVLLAVPDDAVGSVAEALARTDAVVAHVSGSLTLGVLGDHIRTGSIHPLMSLPGTEIGAARLLDACTFAVDGDPLMADVVADLGGLAVVVSDDHRALYHATAAIASNHLTALCAQVERLAGQVGMPVEAYWTLMRTTLDNIESVGAADALTGPAARGDWRTIERHLDALPDAAERTLYLTLCERAATLAGHSLPDALRSDWS